MIACDNLPSAILPDGITTAQVSPARAAYAAALAAVLPVDAQMTPRDFSSTALATATTMPRSLKEPVGLQPSSFKKISAPVSWESVGAEMSGVAPSPSES